MDLGIFRFIINEVLSGKGIISGFSSLQDINLTFNQLCASSPGYTWDVGTDMCYKIGTNVTKNWTDAERICTVNQRHLIKPDTASKNDKLRALLKDTSLNAFWIEALFMSDAETWRWHDNTAIMSMQRGPGDPSGDGKCMDHLKNLAYSWNDHDQKKAKLH